MAATGSQEAQVDVEMAEAVAEAEIEVDESKVYPLVDGRTNKFFDHFSFSESVKRAFSCK
ncbi:MAG: hypothetical protein HRT73_06615 [Flavobacteriales bacterium]|nr:hypothetical protein [Flavobacteriales bacterium]